jgi:TonB family protein
MKVLVITFFFLVVSIVLCAQGNKIELIENKKELKLEDVIYKAIFLPDSIDFDIKRRYNDFFLVNEIPNSSITRKQSSFLFLPDSKVLFLRNWFHKGNQMVTAYKLNYSVILNNIHIEIPQLQLSDFSWAITYDHEINRIPYGFFAKKWGKEYDLKNLFLLETSEMQLRGELNNTNQKNRIIFSLDKFSDYPNFNVKLYVDNKHSVTNLNLNLSSQKTEDQIRMLINTRIWNKFNLIKVGNIGNITIDRELENQARFYINFLLNEVPNYNLEADLEKRKKELETGEEELEEMLNSNSWAEMEIIYAFDLAKEIKSQAEKTELEQKLRLLFLKVRQERDKARKGILQTRYENNDKINKKIQLDYQKSIKEYQRKILEIENARQKASLDFERVYKRKQNKFERNIFERNWAIEKGKIIPPNMPDYELTGPELPPNKDSENILQRIYKIEPEKIEGPIDPDANSPEPVEQPEPAEDEIFTAVEQQAEFPGGPRALKVFLKENLRYPSAAQKANAGGKVYVQFVVNRDGSIQDVQILKSLGFGCDEEAMRLIKAVPRWTPGKQSGRPVRSRFTQPITFVLSEYVQIK